MYPINIIAVIDLDHPADVQIHSCTRPMPICDQIGGDSLEQAFVDAAKAMTHFMTGSTREFAGQASHEIHVEAGDLAALFHDFLGEVLFLFSCGHVAVSYAVKIEGLSVAGRVGTEPFCPALFGHGTEVKAVTFSNLRVGTEKPFDAYVIIDI